MDWPPTHRPCVTLKEGIDSLLAEIVHAVATSCTVDSGISQQVVAFFPQIGFATRRGAPMALEIAHK